MEAECQQCSKLTEWDDSGSKAFCLDCWDRQADWKGPVELKKRPKKSIQKENELATRRRHYVANRDKMLAQRAKYRAANKDKINEYDREYYYINKRKRLGNL